MKRKPPLYCDQCGKEIPYEEEISPIRNLLQQSGILLKQGEGERAREILESVQSVSLSHLYGENCAVFSRGSRNEDNDLTTDIDKLFEGLVPRAGGEAEGQPSQRRSQDECRSPIESIKRPAMGLVRLKLLDYQEHRVFEAPKSHNTADQIPPWGLDSWSVLELLRYLDPYSEDQRTKKRLQCIYDAISERWWRRPLPADSPLREMDAVNVEKLMFAIREKGNEVLYYEPPPAGPRWLLRRDASDKVHHRFLKHVNLKLSDKTRRQAIGYLVAPMPAPRLLEEGPFIKIVKMVLKLWHLDSAFPDSPSTDAVIAKAIRLIGIQKLKRISEIADTCVRAHAFSMPSSLAITPDEVALFLGKHPDMQLTSYDNEIRALLDGFDPERVAVLWLHANFYIRNQIIDAFEKADLQCAHCYLRLPNNAERRWIDRMREWLGQDGLWELYAVEKPRQDGLSDMHALEMPFCLCPEKDLGSSGNERSQWRRKRAKLVAAVVLKYPNLDRDPRHARNARFLLKKMADLMNGKRLRDDTLKRALRRFTEFGGKLLYDTKWQVPGHGETCLADLIDTPFFSYLLRLQPYKQHRTAQDELLRMSRLLEFVERSYENLLLNSRYPIPRREYDPDESVWRRMADEDFNGDPWADDIDDDDRNGSVEIDAYDRDEEREAQASSELRVILKNGGAELETMQELETMSYDELKAKVHQHLKARLKAIGDRIAFLLLSSS